MPGPAARTRIARGNGNRAMLRVTGRSRAAAPAACLIALACLGAPGLAQEPRPASGEPAQAEGPKPDPSTLRICAAASQPPLSMKDGSGLENRIAAAVAEAMGRKPVFVWSSKPAIYLVRDGLDKKL